MAFSASSSRRLLPLLAVFTALTLGASNNAPVAIAQPSEERASYIVTLRPGVDRPTTALELRTQGAEISRVYRHALSGFALRAGSDLAERLRGDVRVQAIEPDRLVHATELQSTPTWGLDRVDQRSQTLDGAFSFDNSGAGVTVYLIDSGLRTTHNEFGGRVETGFSAIDDGYGTDDCNGHGTHVAGTIAGTTFGVAKQATIVPVRVLGCNNSGSWSQVIAGVDWVTAHHIAGVPAVANMSLRGDADDTVDTAVRNSILDGITYTVAAGNDNVDACTKSPARVTEAITVAASTSDDARAPWSNWGACVDLFAPGVYIPSAYNTADDASTILSGTSMATPHVAGIAALFSSDNVAALPGAVAAAITTGATPSVITDLEGSPNKLAYSRLLPPGIVAAVPAAPATPTSVGARRSINVAWNAPADGGSQITDYRVRIHRASDGVAVRTVTVTGLARTTLVKRLRANTSYYATVSATNETGSSPWSTASNLATSTR